MTAPPSRAEAEKNSLIAGRRRRSSRRSRQLEGKAEESRLIGAGEQQRREELAKAAEIEVRLQGEPQRFRGAAMAEAVKLERDAEATAIAARGQAEAQSMSEKAEAYEQYGDAAIVDLLAKTRWPRPSQDLGAAGDGVAHQGAASAGGPPRRATAQLR